MRTDFVVSPTHLAGVIAAATPDELEHGRTWYQREGEWVAATARCYETTPAKVAAITAILSSQMAWDDASKTHPNHPTNKLTALTVLDLLCDHPDRLMEASIFATGMQRSKCRTVYEDPEFTLAPHLGPKVYAFASNLTGDLDQFTCDQHAWAAALGWQQPMNHLPDITRKRRALAEAAYRWMAGELDAKVAEAQAMVWVAWRRVRKEVV